MKILRSLRKAAAVVAVAAVSSTSAEAQADFISVVPDPFTCLLIATGLTGSMLVALRRRAHTPALARASAD